MRVRAFAVLTITLLLTGCASQPGPPALTPHEEAQAWRIHQALVSGLGEWALSGRISVRTEDDSWSGKLRWRQGGEQFHIAFDAPMGMGAARLRSDNTGVHMEVADGKEFSAPDAESLLYQFFGMRLPVTGLRYWVTGLPQPGMSSSLEYDGAGRLARMQQASWDIRYRGYLHVQNVDLPQKIFIENRRLNVRLVIERWDVQV
ncbi:hypothetical protein MNBD_GAMMA20-635 [hydrothermal vent metagenome]|uniref:Outer-membrane lipoprotein LolB n=1 Tax=hydrothermal vent metagenome TaxID=652676 RepID=A0A3B1ABK4_9ZZZZ